jgi:hypothetical protein
LTHHAKAGRTYGLVVVTTEHDASARSVIVVTSSGCHLCELAREVVAGMADEFALEVTVVELRSPEGQRLASSHRMPFPPLVLIDGVAHGHGRISEKRLRRTLEQGTRTEGKGH